MARIHESAATGFARESDTYERARPGFAPEVVRFLEHELALGPGVRLLELGAGTGKLTRLLAPLGPEILVVEPVAEMLAKLREHVPSARRVGGTAEACDLPDASVDAIVAAQAFHWFDAPAALREMHRVLRPDGRVGLVWNRRDESEDWVAKLSETFEPYRSGTPGYAMGRWREPFDDTRLFTPLEHRRFRHVQQLTPEGVGDRVLSISFVAALPEEQRAAVLDRVRALVASHPATAGKQEIQLPYVTDVYTCRKLDERRVA
jgi:SAM-dependent methyltransferase